MEGAESQTEVEVEVVNHVRRVGVGEVDLEGHVDHKVVGPASRVVVEGLGVHTVEVVLHVVETGLDACAGVVQVGDKFVE